MLADVIMRHHFEIERRWLDRVEEQVTAAPGIEPTHLRNGLPDYLLALAATLTAGGGMDIRPSSGSAWSAIAREHGVTRVRIGFNINQLLNEFIILRHVIREVALEHGIETDGPEAVLADSLDAAIAASVSAYVEARDYEARRRQAENVAFLTHELRNPLSNAMTATAQLRQHAMQDQARALDVLERNHLRLLELVDSVLLTQKLESGKVECHPVQVALGDLLDPALEAARAMAARKGVAFHADYDAHQRLITDPVLTRSAIQNLADNAAKFTDHGHVDVVAEVLEDEVVVHVFDSCSGLSREELRVIFEPFERGSSNKSGTGLGLAIARRSVEAQGGRIGAESSNDFGCHFWITLPRNVARG